MNPTLRCLRPQVLLVLACVAVAIILYVSSKLSYPFSEDASSHEASNKGVLLREEDCITYDTASFLPLPSNTMFFLSVKDFWLSSPSDYEHPFFILAWSASTILSYMGQPTSSLKHVLTPPFQLYLHAMPGSGSSLLRHLIENATLLYTGSEKLDDMSSIFPGQGKKDPNQILLVSSTEPTSPSPPSQPFASIYLARHPLAVIMAAARAAKKIPALSDGTSDLPDEWKSFVRTQTNAWVKHFLAWNASRSVRPSASQTTVIVKLEDIAADCGKRLETLFSKDLQIRIFNYYKYEEFWKVRFGAACRLVKNASWMTSWSDSETGSFLETSISAPKLADLERRTWPLVVEMASAILDYLSYPKKMQ